MLVSDGPVDGVLFVETGMVSMLAGLEDGTQIEVGLVGPDGLVGLPLLFGVATSPVEAVVQAAGTALRLPAPSVPAAVGGVPSRPGRVLGDGLDKWPVLLLPGLLLRYVDAFHHQVAQTAACNGRHRIEQRLARWILMTHDRIDGDRLLMTQEFMSYMLGVQRPGVNLAVRTLERAGLVQRQKGQVRVLDRSGLEALACECHALVRRRYAWLMDAHMR